LPAVHRVIQATKAGASLQDRLAPQDARDAARGAICKVYQVRLEANRTYVIDMISSEFDTYLRLVDAANREVARNDDGGEDLNARIRRVITQAGDYRIVASAYGSDIGGAFTLVVREE
jgi:serine protease Do